MNNVIDQLHTLLSAAMTTKFKTYYKGRIPQAVVPESYSPALLIFPVDTNVIAKSTAKDQYQYTVTVQAKISLKKFVDEAGTGNVMKAQRELVDLMEERNADGTLKSDTVLGTVRGNIKTDDFLFNNDINIDYDFETNWPEISAKMQLTLTTDLLLRP